MSRAVTPPTRRSVVRVASPALCVLMETGLVAAARAATATAAVDPQSLPPATPVEARIPALDAAVFDAFNRCDEPAQLERHAAYFDPAVEFYHDTGGVTWTREAMLANTRAHACGKFRRELVPGTLRVAAVKAFGAIATGTHRFCQSDTGTCAGEADFAIVWREHAGQWRITRVLSYGHRAVAGPDARPAP